MIEELQMNIQILNKNVPIPQLPDIQKIYVIHMKDRHDRWIQFEEKMKNANIDISKIEVFDAIVGKNWIKDRNNFERFLTPRAQYILTLGTRQMHEDIGTPGGVGCHLSHFGVWEKMLSENIERALILEDDVELVDNFVEKFSSFWKEYTYTESEIFDVFALGIGLRDDVEVRTNEKKTITWMKVPGKWYDLSAYIVTNNFARKMIPFKYPIELQIDGLLSYLTFMKRIVVHAAYDRFASQTGNFTTDVQGSCFGCLENDIFIAKYLEQKNKLGKPKKEIEPIRHHQNKTLKNQQLVNNSFYSNNSVLWFSLFVIFFGLFVILLILILVLIVKKKKLSTS